MIREQVIRPTACNVVYSVVLLYTHTHHSHMSMTTIYIEICVKDWMMLSAFVITNHTHTLLNRTQSSRHSINICSLSSLLNLLVEHLWFLITTRLQLRSLKGEPYISHLLIVITAYRSSLIVLAYKVQRERENYLLIYTDTSWWVCGTLFNNNLKIDHTKIFLR